MRRMERKYISYGILVFLLLISLTTVNAGLNNNHSNTGDKKCVDCHSDIHQQNNNTGNKQIIRQQANIEQPKDTINIDKTAVTEVIGNILLVASMGQNWYQQGIYGPNYNTNDQSWGWTFFDETPPSNYIIPPEKVTQRNNIYALLLDDGNDSNPISGANVIANVTYWTYNGTSYANNISSIQLTEDINKKGFYSGIFYFYGGTSYSYGTMQDCDGCHPFGQDNQLGYFSGNYTVSIKAEADNKIRVKNTNFEVTPWGCEDCHGSGNQHGTSWLGMNSACYLCHGVNRIVHDGTDAGNPHQNTAHRNINCEDCHTNREIDQNFNGVTFSNGGINNAPIPQYSYNQISLNGGKHSSLSCADCHGNLALPTPNGGYNSGSYTIDGIVNMFEPSFTSIQQFQDYYVVNVTQGGPLNISFNWEGASNLGFYLYPPNFNPRNRTNPPSYNGATHSNKPESYTNDMPMSDKWMLNPYGYDLYDPSPCPPLCESWNGTLQSPINYTISSTYPLEKKNLPSVPECKNCHNSSATGGAQTDYEIPNWNPGFAHVDTNDDGSLDIQCRMCHDTIHNIGTTTCQNCHITAPTGHFIQEPSFSQYTPSQCLQCHGDPHKVTGGGGSCIDCHSIKKNDVNVSKFGRHANLDTSDGLGVVSDNDCWTCHRNKDMDKNNIYLCQSCHINNNGVIPVNDPALIISDFSHGEQQCKSCHAPTKYHMDGTVGPKGLMDLFNFN